MGSLVIFVPYAWLSVIVGGIGEDLQSFNILSLVSSLVPRPLPHISAEEEPGYKATWFHQR